VHFILTVKEEAQEFFESQRGLESFKKELSREFFYHPAYDGKDLGASDVLEMVKFEAKQSDIKIGFRYDHYAYALLEMERDRKLRLPRDVLRLKVS
jgi:hypothetical protein